MAAWRITLTNILAQLVLLKTAIQNNTFFELVGGAVIKLKDAYNEIRKTSGDLKISNTDGIIEFETTAANKIIRFNAKAHQEFLANGVVLFQAGASDVYMAVDLLGDGGTTVSLGSLTRPFLQAFLKNRTESALTFLVTLNTNFGAADQTITLPHTVPTLKYDFSFIQMTHTNATVIPILRNGTKTTTQFDISARDLVDNLPNCAINNEDLYFTLNFYP